MKDIAAWIAAQKSPAGSGNDMQVYCAKLNGQD
jgi:hypothetical protein